MSLVLISELGCFPVEHCRIETSWASENIVAVGFKAWSIIFFGRYRCAFVSTA